MWTAESGVGPILELAVVSRMTKQNYYARALTWKTYGSSSNTNTIYRPDCRQQHHQKYVFLLCRTEAIPDANPRSLFECWIHWVWNREIEPNEILVGICRRGLVMFNCAKVREVLSSIVPTQHTHELSVLNYYGALSQLDYSNSYRSQTLSRQMRWWMVEADFYLISLTFPLTACSRAVPGQDVTFALSSAHYIAPRFLPLSPPSRKGLVIWTLRTSGVEHLTILAHVVVSLRQYCNVIITLHMSTFESLSLTGSHNYYDWPQFVTISLSISPIHCNVLDSSPLVLVVTTNGVIEMLTSIFEIILLIFLFNLGNIEIDKIN